MNKNLPTALALGFFAGIFLLAFSTPDSVVATYRVVGFVGVACAAGLVAIYWNRIRGTRSATSSSHAETKQKQPAAFTDRYGHMATLTDKLKAMRQKRHRPTLLHH